MNLPNELKAIWLSYLDGYEITKLCKANQELEFIKNKFSFIVELIFFNYKKHFPYKKLFDFYSNKTF